jgi:glutathione S-transferase
VIRLYDNLGDDGFLCGEAPSVADFALFCEMSTNVEGPFEH